MKEYDSSSWHMWLPWLPVILAVFNLWGNLLMLSIDFESILLPLITALIGLAGVVLAALITGAVSLIVQNRQLKRDGKTIDSICSDTSDIKPKVDNINSTVQAIAPSIIRVEERSGKIDSVAAAVESFKYLKDHASDSTIKPEELLAHMSKVFEEKAALTTAHKNDQVRIAALTAECGSLTSENMQLCQQVQELEKELEVEKLKNTQERYNADWRGNYEPEF